MENFFDEAVPQARDRKVLYEKNDIGIVCIENLLIIKKAGRKNPKLSITNAFDVIDRIPGKKRGTGVILCMYGSPLWLKENIVALPVEFC